MIVFVFFISERRFSDKYGFYDSSSVSASTSPTATTSSPANQQEALETLADHFESLTSCGDKEVTNVGLKY